MKKSLFLLRVALGWVFFYAGISKLMDPDWSAARYLAGAKSFGGIYTWLGSSANIGWVNFINEWGLLLVGLALIIGFRTKIAAIAGSVFMAAYYLPILDFPYAGTSAFLVDDHIVYILALIVLAATGAGKYWGLDKNRGK